MKDGTWIYGRIMRRLLFICLWGSPFFSFSQPHYAFKKLTNTEGLSQSAVATIVQDTTGFIWFGTWKGLFKYDGYTFKPIDFGSNEALISALEIDQAGKLWIGTYDGLFIRDLRTGLSKKAVQDLNDLFVNNIVSEDTGAVYVASNHGVFKADTTSIHQPKQWVEKIDGIRRHAYSLKAIGKHLLVGTDIGIQVFRLDDLKHDESFSWVSEATQNYRVTQIQLDNRNRLWIGTESSGIFMLDLSSKSMQHFTSQNTAGFISNWIRKVIIDHLGNVLVGTRSGLMVYEETTKSFLDLSNQSFFSDQVYDNKIWNVFEDRDHNIWIGTFAGEIFQHHSNDANFKYIGVEKWTEDGLKHPLVHAISQDTDRVWLGTFGGGLYYIDKGNLTSIKPFPSKGIPLNKEIKTLVDDRIGNLWIGTTNGLYIIDKNTGQVTIQESEDQLHNIVGLSRRLINIMIEDEDTIWVGTNGRGLYQVDKKSYVWTSVDAYNKEQARIPVTALLKDGKYIWIGSQGGLFKFDKEQRKIIEHFHSETSSSGLNSNWVTTLLKDDNGDIWIGTERGGLYVLNVDQNNIYRLNDSYDDFDKSIHTLIQDQQKRIWVTTDNGLYSLDIEKNTSGSYFSKSSTFINQYVPATSTGNRYYLSNSGVMVNDSTIVFGGMNGLTVFDPHRLQKTKLYRPVAITDVIIPGNQIDKKQLYNEVLTALYDRTKLHLSSDVNTITIHFSSMDYPSADFVKYAYQLVHHNEESKQWISTTANNASFMNLKPGTYTFKVRRIDYGNKEEYGATTFTFVILPPYYLTNTAYAIYFLLFSGLAYIVFRFFSGRIKLQKQLKREQAEKRRQEELYALRMNFYTNVSHEIRTPLSLISLPVDQLYKKETDVDSRKKLEVVRKNVDRMLRLINELLDFRKMQEKGIDLDLKPVNIVDFSKDIFESFALLAKQKNITYEFQHAVDHYVIHIDPTHIEKVLLNLLSNAFKNTKSGGHIRLYIEEELSQDNQRILRIMVQDNGAGIPQAYLAKVFDNFYQVPDVASTRESLGSGLGLSIVKEIIELHQGKIYASSDVAKDGQKRLTTFSVELKYKVLESLSTDTADSYFDTSIAIKDLLPSIETINFDRQEKFILVVEDNVELNNLIVSSLKTEGYQISHAFNGKEGLKIAQQKLPDLIISDVLMPEMNGLVFCAAIKQNVATSHIPVMLLTARNAQEHQLQGYQYGADIYITKPFKEEMLLLHVTNILKTQHAQQKANLTRLITEPKAIEKDQPTREQVFLQSLMVIIENNLGDPSFQVERIAKEIGMSKAVLYKKVNALANTTIAELIKIARLKKAANYLENQDMTVSQIAYMVGFSDPKYFSKEFKKYYGKSPSAYANK